MSRAGSKPPGPRMRPSCRRISSSICLERRRQHLPHAGPILLAARQSRPVGVAGHVHDDRLFRRLRCLVATDRDRRVERQVAVEHAGSAEARDPELLKRRPVAKEDVGVHERHLHRVGERFLLARRQLGHEVPDDRVVAGEDGLAGARLVHLSTANVGHPHAARRLGGPLVSHSYRGAVEPQPDRRFLLVETAVVEPGRDHALHGERARQRRGNEPVDEQPGDRGVPVGEVEMVRAFLPRRFEVELEPGEPGRAPLRRMQRRSGVHVHRVAKDHGREEGKRLFGHPRHLSSGSRDSSSSRDGLACRPA